MKHLRAYVRADAASLLNDPAAPVPWIASRPGIMSDGVDLRAEDWDLSRFAKHGPVLWAHDYAGRNLPIGTGTARIEGGRLLVDVRYDEGDSFAMAVRRKALLGMIAASVGWDDVKVGKETKHQLLELSNVPVPLDPGALIDLDGLPRGQGAQTAYLARSLTAAVRRQVAEPFVRARADLEATLARAELELTLSRMRDGGADLLRSLERLGRVIR